MTTDNDEKDPITVKKSPKMVYTKRVSKSGKVYYARKRKNPRYKRSIKKVSKDGNVYYVNKDKEIRRNVEKTYYKSIREKTKEERKLKKRERRKQNKYIRVISKTGNVYYRKRKSLIHNERTVRGYIRKISKSGIIWYYKKQLLRKDPKDRIRKKWRKSQLKVLPSGYVVYPKKKKRKRKPICKKMYRPDGTFYYLYPRKYVKIITLQRKPNTFYGEFLPFFQVRAFIRSLQLTSYAQWKKYYSKNRRSIKKGLPRDLYKVYPTEMRECTDLFTNAPPKFFTYEQSKKIVRELGIQSEKQFKRYVKSDENKKSRPRIGWVWRIFPDQWTNWYDFLDKEKPEMYDYHTALLVTAQHKCAHCDDYRTRVYPLDPKLPLYPEHVYKEWNGWREFLAKNVETKVALRKTFPGLLIIYCDDEDPRTLNFIGIPGNKNTVMQQLNIDESRIKRMYQNESNAPLTIYQAIKKHSVWHHDGCFLCKNPADFFFDLDVKLLRVKI